MKIGILGAGNVGGALGDAWRRHEHEIMFGVKNPGAAKSLAHSGSVRDAARFGEVVVIALPFQAAYDLTPSLDLKDKTVIDCTNVMGALRAAGSFESGAETLQALAPDARFVKAFNTTGANNMKNPDYRDGRLAMFYCGDYAEAKTTVQKLVSDIGFSAVDAGPLSNARLLEAQAELVIWLASQGGLG